MFWNFTIIPAALPKSFLGKLYFLDTFWGRKCRLNAENADTKYGDLCCFSLKEKTSTNNINTDLDNPQIRRYFSLSKTHEIFIVLNVCVCASVCVHACTSHLNYKNSISLFIQTIVVLHGLWCRPSSAFKCLNSNHV